MPYSDADMREIDKCPQRTRAYYWRMCHHWVALAQEHRERSRRGEDPEEHLKWANILARMAKTISENIDEIIEAQFADADPK